MSSDYQKLSRHHHQASRVRRSISSDLHWPRRWPPLPSIATPVAGGRGTPFLRSVVRVWICRSWCVVGVVGAAPGRINLLQLYSHTGGVFHGDVSELMALCVCRSFRSAALGFMDGVSEAATATPSGVSLLLLCPRCCGVVSDTTVELGDFAVRE